MDYLVIFVESCWGCYVILSINFSLFYGVKSIGLVFERVEKWKLKVEVRVLR